jgi:RNA repair pathway DNA polymerase beta family
MDLIVEMRFGSHLYGTATPSSDLDYKAIYLPAATDILLQRVSGTVSLSREKAAGEKNSPGDVDREVYSLQRYLELLAEGQTVALDMLFAPDSAMTRSPSPLWREIQANAQRLVTRRASAFVRYCGQQANKYGIKGSRVAVARQALAVLTTAEGTYGATAKLADAETELTAFTGTAKHAALLDVALPGDNLVRHLEICGKRMPFTASIKNARGIAQRLVENYGQRALQAECNEGVDWKALSHAVRVGHEALELFETSRISFPLPNAAEILSIKRGERPYEAVAATIERLLVAVESAAATSALRNEPDQDFIDDFIVRAYRSKILEAG